MTGSGYGHVLVGAPGASPAGAVILSPGGNPPSTEDLITLTGEVAGDHFGYTVGGASRAPPSFSGDPRPDTAAGPHPEARRGGHGGPPPYSRSTILVVAVRSPATTLRK